ncbi:MAG: hypothetical protein BGO49_00680 [Planctomycetales bacterium 71-10]|nr:MAG: hypothetical protein BGO49_00680 [Planctomycetales bacterium 71-10]
MPEEQLGMTVGDVRRAIAGLPDSATVHPDWSDFPGDDDPAVRLDFVRAAEDEDGPYLSVGVALVHLDGLDMDDDEDAEDDDFGDGTGEVEDEEENHAG